MINISFADFRSVVLENSRRLSRTRLGVGDTSSSLIKRAPALLGEDLARIAGFNEENACLVVWRQAQDITSMDSKRLTDELLEIAASVNEGLVPPGKIFREWVPPQGKRSAVEAVPTELEGLIRQVVSLSQGGLRDAVRIAAMAEWRLNGGDLHPFYDGCGRISRLFSSRILLAYGHSIPLWESRDTYFAVGARGELWFSNYMRKRIAAGSAWLRARTTPGNETRPPESI